MLAKRQLRNLWYDFNQSFERRTVFRVVHWETERCYNEMKENQL